MTDRRRWKVTGLWGRQDKLARTFFTAKTDLDRMYAILEEMEDQGVTKFDITILMSEGKRTDTSPDATLIFSEYAD